MSLQQSTAVSLRNGHADQTSLAELGLLFLRLGATAFGGPLAHIAMMQQEVVLRRRWLSEERFLDLLSATNLIPGPNSTELAIHIGWERRRWAGLFVAGLAFILPAMCITGVLAWAYLRYAALPGLPGLLYGVKPVIVAIVSRAIGSLAPKAARTATLRGLGLLCVALAALNVDELLVLFGAGALAVLAGRISSNQHPPGAGKLLQLPPLLPVAAVGAFSAGAATLPGIFGVFLKIGSVLFGSGYVLIAFLRTDLVQRLHWLNEAQLLDAVAVGQITPGPVFTTATFIGYLLAGPSGALIATAGIFLPAFAFVALSGPLIPKLRASPSASAFLDGVNVASLALMALVTFELARSTLTDAPAVVIGLVSGVLLSLCQVNASWLVVGGGMLGMLIHYR